MHAQINDKNIYTWPKFTNPCFCAISLALSFPPSISTAQLLLQPTDGSACFTTTALTTAADTSSSRRSIFTMMIDALIVPTICRR